MEYKYCGYCNSPTYKEYTTTIKPNEVYESIICERCNFITTYRCAPAFEYKKPKLILIQGGKK